MNGFNMTKESILIQTYLLFAHFSSRKRTCPFDTFNRRCVNMYHIRKGFMYIQYIHLFPLEPKTNTKWKLLQLQKYAYWWKYLHVRRNVLSFAHNPIDRGGNFYACPLDIANFERSANRTKWKAFASEKCCR